MIKTGRMNEAYEGTDLNFWENEDPHAYDESTTQDMIASLKLAAKVLKCSEKEVVFFEEASDERFVGKVHTGCKNAKEIKDANAEKIGREYLDGRSGLWEKDGIRYITINSWGYAQVICKKSDVKKLLKLNESIESNATQMNEAAKIRSMTKQMGQAYSGCWQLPSGKPGMITTSSETGIELVLCGSENDGLQLIMTLEDGEGDYFKDYKWDTKSEATAVHHFQEIAKIIDNEFIDLSKVAKKFGLKSM